MLGLRSRARADGTAVRGSVAGVATAGGAVVAHAVGGGEVAPLAALAALLVAVPLSARLLRPGRTDAARLLAASLGVQGLWHAFLLLTASTGSSHAGHEMGGMNHDPAAAGHASLDMLLLHLTAGLLAAGLAVGADRAVLGLLRELAGRILPGLPGLVPVPVVSTVGVVPHLVAPRSTVSRSVTARGPPTSGAFSPLLA